MLSESIKSADLITGPRDPRFNVKASMTVGGATYGYWSLREFERKNPEVRIASLPYCTRILLENLLRHFDGETVTEDAVLGVARVARVPIPDEVPYYPSRVVMPDSSGVPALVDLAAMRDVLSAKGFDPTQVNPVVPVQLIADHSAVAHFSGTADAMDRNLELEFRLNSERFSLIRWAQQAFENFKVVPPGSGILHQINLEYLAEVITVRSENNDHVLFPDSLVGTDSHTPMVNGLGLFGWGVGGVEAASAILGEPITMRIPEVVGCRVTGKLSWGVTATDVVLTVTQLMRQKGVLGCFVEFFGDGLSSLTVPDRATISNMTPEYGATMGYFPIDEQTIAYLRSSGRTENQCRLVERYAQEQYLWRSEVPVFGSVVELDLNKVERCVSGPRRPQDKVPLGMVPKSFDDAFSVIEDEHSSVVEEEDEPVLRDGDVVIAAITSCTNTSNPSVMIGAGLLARNAVNAGLTVKNWVKTSLSPGSRRVAEYLKEAGLVEPLNKLGFQIVGYGCMTCMGSSGPLKDEVVSRLHEKDVTVAAVVSSNRNFEARVHLQVRANYLASPPLVIAYALAGSVRVNLSTDPVGYGTDGRPIYLADLWPTDDEISAIEAAVVKPELFKLGYASIEEGTRAWKELPCAKGPNYKWDAESTYVQPPPYVHGKAPPKRLKSARAIVILGDDVTTDHIAPVGITKADSQVGKYLIAHGVQESDFNTLSSRRANPHVVARTAYANVQLHNELTPGIEGEFTRYGPTGEVMPVFTAAQKYSEGGVPLIVIAGKNYGAGSSRDSAAKGVRLLGVQAVIAESFERIHRSNLVCMGVLPLEFMEGETRDTLLMLDAENFDILDDLSLIHPRGTVSLKIHHKDGSQVTTMLRIRVDTSRELQWYRSGGVMPYVLSKLSEKPHGRQHVAAS